MHPAAYDFVARNAGTSASHGQRILDLGGQDINGSPRVLFDDADDYDVLDITDGSGVDIVADATSWRPAPTDTLYDVVVCCEVLEHLREWPAVLRTAYAALRPGGRLIVTAAGPGRAPHSGRSAAPTPEPGEWYDNIPPNLLGQVLQRCGFNRVILRETSGAVDVQATATKPEHAPQAGAVHLLTSIFGGYDRPMVPVAQDGVESVVLVTDDYRAAEDAGWFYSIRHAAYLPNHKPDPRHAARWPKFLPHDALAPNAETGDIVVWVDGRVVITDSRFCSWIVEQLGDADMAAWRHPSLVTVAEQVQACIREQPHKYDEASLLAHLEHRRGRWHDGMHQLTIMATRLNYRTQAAGRQILTEMGAWRRSIDQIAFPFAVHDNLVRVVDLPGGQGGFWSHEGGMWRLTPHRDGT